MRYDSYSYLWPPRPVNSIQTIMLPFYERQGHVAQIKMNGTCSVIAVSPDGYLTTMTRHNEPHRAWAPTEGSSKAFRSLPGEGWYVFVAELMHSKVPGIRDINYINDILVHDGEHLTGATYSDRQQMLTALFPAQSETLSHYVVDAHTWLAKTHTGGFQSLFKGLSRPEHEGLVIKNPKAPLALCFRENGNWNWQVKIRKPTKNYSS